MIDFNYFCTQKWLEYKDNLTLDLMSEEEYRNKHHDWLLEQYNKEYIFYNSYKFIFLYSIRIL